MNEAERLFTRLEVATRLLPDPLDGRVLLVSGRRELRLQLDPVFLADGARLRFERDAGLVAEKLLGSLDVVASLLTDGRGQRLALLRRADALCFELAPML